MTASARTHHADGTLLLALGLALMPLPAGVLPTVAAMPLFIVS